MKKIVFTLNNTNTTNITKKLKQFKQAILQSINDAVTDKIEKTKSLFSLNFQTFQNTQIVTLLRITQSTLR